MNFEKAFDYIIVGAGASGCVIANRLIENLDCHVLLLEAGDADNNPTIHNTDIQSMTSLWSGTTDWGYSTEEEPYLNNRKISIAQGKVLGGGTSVNAMMYIRGNRRNYDHWNGLGNENWSYQDVLPYFKKSENYQGGSPEYRGSGGVLNVIDYANPSPVSQAFVAAAVELGYQGNGWDCNGQQQENGAFFYQSTRTKDNQRCSTAVAFITPILGNPNLTVETKALVTRILISANKAIGLEYLQEGKLHQVKAQSEIIISSGSFESPKLLMLSGIGPAEHLKAHHIPVIVDLPGVGQNLQDHLLLGVGYECKQEQPLPNLLSEAGLFTWTRSGITSASPDLQFFFGPVQFIEPEYRTDGPGFTFAPIVAQPQSRGTISLRSNNPQDLAVIQANYLQCETDINVFIRGIQLARELVDTSPFNEFRGRELAPGPSVTSSSDLSAYIRRVCSTVWHPVGTCKMGRDHLAVVNPQLQVYGIEGLRVADASIMPTITSGNTNAPVIMIGEKAADMIITLQKQ
ncbi:alcohol dehydrogenase [acceptor] [Microcystis aeruginosa NIES-2519]|uniref:Alcohol dehydrogenase [acceptor] n=1 Tax=Microcystis aeruginosa NIES-2519 TaxID=2303981 RepID=A0A5A5R4A0_MICAE|nr:MULTISPECIES: GMC family oxidoreductase N-terminal domain-containing protein [Microcystis]AVQ71171.1 choline dehydrogenase [Microcystis sp. MC19]CCI30821.1 putative choline dehydrogenase betA-like [Microcystis sp. T1-4]GCA71023.1 alcohol dehydrogenase [acceptor] [Microcystis aeruginosa NIES-2519]GCA84813.1 alcohol dehydrogenase [acceptor] [Microcystis aeruginosa NIES-2522]GCA89270.1 alcohol dehydrogenase [acceptor] [Microcystis aeruginosa NIES-4264]